MITKLFHSGIEKKIINNLKNSNEQVKIAVAWFTNPRLFNSILKLTETGVSVDLILCGDKINFTNSKVDFEKLIDLGVNIRVSKSPHLMHNKFCLIDNRVLINGSYNWTMRAEKFNFENIIISTDKELINDFDDYFNELKEKTTRIESIPKVPFESYHSQEEIDLEFGLMEEEGDSLEDFGQGDIVVYTDKIKRAIKKANLLYRSAEHLKCIEFCKDQIQLNPQIAEFYLILAQSNWRLGNNNEIIASAQKVIAIDNELYEAYNMLGLGFGEIKGGEQDAIKNFNICLAEFPNNHIYLRNRALARIKLENDQSIPEKFRAKYEEKVDDDLNRIINIVNEKSENECTYHELYSKAIAHDCLIETSLAIKSIDVALEKYKNISDKSELDKNVYIEMKNLRRDLKKQK